MSDLDWADEKAARLSGGIAELEPAIAAALRAARDEGIEASWEAAYSVMSNETNASQRRVSKAIRDLKHKEPADAE